MPTQSTTYNTRLTDESLEKRFRDTFRSQGGAELVDDLYASGVIVPVVDFTNAAEGSALRTDLQTAWDFATIHKTANNNSQTLTSTAGFWKVDLVFSAYSSSSVQSNAELTISDGLTSKVIWEANIVQTTVAQGLATDSDQFVVFLRSNDILSCATNASAAFLDVSIRQIATVNGDITNPSGFSSS